MGVCEQRASLERYLRGSKPGDAVVVRSGWGDIITYATATITTAEYGQVRLDNGQSFYIKTGKNCWHAKGQTWLMEPTPDSLALTVTGFLPGVHTRR